MHRGIILSVLIRKKKGIIPSVLVHLALIWGGMASHDQIEKVAVILKELKEGGKGLEVLMINEKRPNSQTFPMFGQP